ncbi:hypothetical protein F994_02754 [Acinetobacter bohemicus ANC 3994]|uniref:Uncharacterized protein n=1 Tax=Acinetobacter bohemicus ANC 3994 TaxID=1217715 RepID=N8NWM1_9GAMM|nr:hypothetical protein [Acinetobacter bohemicus]ENU18796.1 hypothetical protein F994_02754 [Acinetobacter bohemicus ANC 3994]
MQIIHPFNSTLYRNEQQAIKAKAKSGSHVTLVCYLKHFLNLKWKTKQIPHLLVTNLPLLVFLNHFENAKKAKKCAKPPFKVEKIIKNTP